MAENKISLKIPNQSMNPHIVDNISEATLGDPFKEGLTISRLTDSTDFGGVDTGIVETYMMGDVVFQQISSVKDNAQKFQSRIGKNFPDEESWRPNFYQYPDNPPGFSLTLQTVPWNSLAKNVLYIGSGSALDESKYTYIIQDGALRTQRKDGSTAWLYCLIGNQPNNNFNWEIEHRIKKIVPGTYFEVGIRMINASLAHLMHFLYNGTNLTLSSYPSTQTVNLNSILSSPLENMATKISFNKAANTLTFLYKLPNATAWTTLGTRTEYTPPAFVPAWHAVGEISKNSYVESSQFLVSATWTAGHEPTFVPSLAGGWSDFISPGENAWNYTAENLTILPNTKYFVDTTTSVVSLTCPTANLELGDSIEIKDYADTFGVNPCTLLFGGVPFEGDGAATYVLDWKGAAIELVYTGTDIGWKRVKE